MKRLLPLAIALVVLLTTGLIFFETLVTRAVAWKLERSMTFETRTVGQGQLIYERPSLGSVGAERLAVDIKARLWPYKVRVRGRFEGAVVEPTLKKDQLPKVRQRKWLRWVQCDLEVVDGEWGGGTVNGRIRLAPRLSGNLTVRDVTVTSHGWQLVGTSGGLVLSGDEVTLAAEGQLHYREQECALQVAGRTRLGPEVDLSLGLSWGDGASTALQMSGNELRLELEQVGHGHALILQTIARDMLPALRHINLSEGHLSASIHAEVDEGRLNRIEVEHFSSERLSFSYPPLGMEGALEAASGSWRADVTPRKQFTHICGDVKISDGRVAFQDGFELSDLHGEVRVRDNVLKGGSVSGHWNGLAASMELGRMTPKGRVTVRLEGPAERFSTILPKGFEAERVSLEGGVWQQGAYLHVEGVCALDADRLPFGVRLHHLAGQPARPWAELLLDLIGYPTHALLPGSGVGLSVESGWLSGTGVDAARFVQPLLKKPADMRIAGEVDFTARLIDKDIVVDYVGQQICLEARRFQTFLPRIEAEHVFSLADGSERGSIPVTAGIYLEKSTGLLFTDTTCHIDLDDGHLDVRNIETTCEGVCFSGHVIVDDPHVLIFSPNILGTAEGAQRILQRICPMACLDWPLAGDVCATGEGLALRLLVGEPEKTECRITAHLEHELYRGAILYDHARRTLALTDIEVDGRSYRIESGRAEIAGLPGGDLSLSLPIVHAGKRCALVDGTLSGQELVLKTENGELRAQLNPSDEGWEVRAVTAFYGGRSVRAAKPFLCTLTDRLEVRDLALEFGGQPYNIRRCTVQFAPEATRVQAIAQLGGRDYWLSLLSRDQTELVISELNARATAAPTDPLTLTLTPRVVAARGTLHGMTVDLVATDEEHHFEGEVSIDARRTSPLLPVGLASFFKAAQAGQGYRLRGNFHIENGDLHSLAFDGDLSGRNYALMGYRLAQLQGKLSFSPQHLTLTDCELSDPGGQFGIDRLTGKKDDNGTWRFHIPLATFRDFRPSILTRTDGRPMRPKTFTFTRGEIHHLFGSSLGSHAWTGQGSFSFINPPRNSPAGTPFAIPDQILGKLGLDLAALVPSFGNIAFHVRDSRIIFSNFENVFSRGHRSQFFLDPIRPSSIALTGRLDLHFRMKQNNLLLKLTEKFNLAVGGTIERPRYRLEPRA